MKYNGSCHCGNIKYSFDSEEIKKGTRCNCSICIRKGAVMTLFTKSISNVNLEIKNDSLTTYSFATHQAQHHFCNNCGIYTFHESMINKGEYRFNIGCLEDVDSTQLPFDIYDGKNLI